MRSTRLRHGGLSPLVMPPAVPRFSPSSLVDAFFPGSPFSPPRSILEPAGALSVAGAKAWLAYYGYKVREGPKVGHAWH